MKLAALIVGEASGGLWRRSEQVGTRSFDFVHRVRPGAMQLHDLRASDEAASAVRDAVRLALAPVLERRRPLLRSAQIEDLRARIDHAAVDIADVQREYLSGSDGDHHLVEQRQPFGHLAQLDQRASLPMASERDEVRIAEAPTDRERLREQLVSAGSLAAARRADGIREEQIAAHHTV